MTPEQEKLWRDDYQSLDRRDFWMGIDFYLAARKKAQEVDINVLDSLDRHCSDLKKEIQSLKEELIKAKEEISKLYDAQYGHSRDQFEQLQDVAVYQEKEIEKRDKLLAQAVPFIDSFECSTDDQDSQDAKQWLTEYKGMKG